MISPNLLTTCFFGAATGLVSAYLAYKRGRSPYLWFFVGFFFGLLGTIALFFAPKGKKNLTPLVQPVVPEPYIHGPIDKFWYYLDSQNSQVGPISHDTLSTEWEMGNLSKETYVWHEDLTEWKSLGDVIRNR